MSAPDSDALGGTPRRRLLTVLGRCLSVFWSILLWLLVAIGAVTAASALWIRRTFGVISVDQMLSNLPGGDGGAAEATPAGYVEGFVVQALVIPLVAVAVLVVAVIVLRRRAARKAADDGAAARSRMRARVLRGAGTSALAILACVAGAALFAQTIGLPQYIRASTSELTLSSYYTEPVVVSGAEKPRNLVLIYLESIEDAFADDRMFEKNMLAPLQAETSDWQRIESLRQYDGGGWTMAGIVSTQCGVPLRGTKQAKAGALEKIGRDEAEYLPGADCLGDVLERNGYTNVFLGGANAEFASKAHFLRSHGYTEVLDESEWRDRGETEFSEWGLSDRALMRQAEAEVDRLHATAQPFNLTMLTLDTHEPAHSFDYCPTTTKTEMTSITTCSMRAVAEFIDHLESRGYLEDTAVVLMGDHEKFVSEASNYPQLARLDDRTIFNRIWSPDGATPQRDDIDQLSMQATMLELLGFELQDHRAGVGVSALAGSEVPYSILDLDPDRYTEVVESRSADLYARMWGLSEGETVEADFFDPKNPDRAAGASDDPGGTGWWRPNGLRDTPPAPPALHAG